MEPTALAAAVDLLATRCRPTDRDSTDQRSTAQGSTAPGSSAESSTAQGSSDAVRVLDLGGGTGGQALRLVLAGHDVTVVDPSPDALAALARRAAEAGVADRLRGVQGDAEGLGAVLGAASVDLVLCHGVLEVVDDPQVALTAIRRVLRSSGRLSLLVAQRHAAVLARVSAGQVRQAHHIALDPDGRWGAGDLLRRRFDRAGVAALLEASGFRPVAVDGVRVFADLLPATSRTAAEDADRTLLADLEAWAGGQPGFLDVAAQLHVDAAPV